MANLVAYLNARPISTRFHIRVATVRVVQVMRETTGINLPAGARPTSTAKFRPPDIVWRKMSGFGADQGTGATLAAVVRSTGPGKASPTRGGGRTAKRMRRREPGKVVAVWSSISQRAWAACVRCGELSGA